MLVLSIICAVVSFAFLMGNLIKGEMGWALIWLLVLGINIYSVVLNLSDNENGEKATKTYVIQDVKGYQVDSTTVINGADTTKTYVLTYWK